MKGKIVLGILIGAVLVGIGAVTVIRSRENVTTYSEDLEKEDEVVTLTWYINYSWFDSEWGDNIVSRKITEATGVEIEFIVPKGTESEKLDSMINTDTLPDLVTLGWWDTENQEMIRQDQVYAWKKRTTNHKYTARRGSGYDALSARNAAKAGPAGLCRAV